MKRGVGWRQRPTLVRVMLLVALGLTALPLTTPPAATASPPNIILILTDDLDVSAVQYMPSLLSLVRDQGADFTNFFITTPVCCPSRSSILRGQFAHNHGVLRNEGKDGGFETFYALKRERSTIGVWLQQAGYQTAMIGKYLNGYPNTASAAYVPPGWDEWFVTIQHRYFDYEADSNGTLVHYGEAPEEYVTDVMSARASEFIQRSTAADTPFFLYLGVRAPHGPATPAPRHLGAMTGIRAPRTPAFNERDTSDKPRWVRQNNKLGDGAMARIDAEYQRRLESLLAVDEMIAGLVETLAATGTLDNTYIMFTSDNGYHLGEHRIPPRKGTPYDEATRVPLFVRGPAVPAAVQISELAANIDLAPTFAELAGADPPDFVDGRSLVSLLRGDRVRNWREVMLIEDFGGDLAEGRFEGDDVGPPGHGVPPFWALRADHLLYVEYLSGEQELYDLREDPWALVNLAGRADPALLARLAARLHDLADCKADDCRRLDAEPIDQIGRLGTKLHDFGAEPKDAGDIFLATADTAVAAAEPTINRGGSERLLVDGGTGPAETFLQFYVQGVSGAVTRATLRVYVSTAPDADSRHGPVLFQTTNDWTERDLTWEGRPPLQGNRLDRVGRVDLAEWVSFDVTAVVVRDGIYSFVIATDNVDGVILASRESKFPPHLVVETAPAGEIETMPSVRHW